MLYHKKPIRSPKNAAIKMEISPTFGIYIIFKYAAKFTFPDTHAKTPKAKTIIADVQAANPSIPSVRFAPLDTAVIIKITMGMKTNQT